MDDLELDYSQENVITRVAGMYKDWFLDYASYVMQEEQAAMSQGLGL